MDDEEGCGVSESFFFFLETVFLFKFWILLISHLDWKELHIENMFLQSFLSLSIYI
jgi:hypothetical protein